VIGFGNISVISVGTVHGQVSVTFQRKLSRRASFSVYDFPDNELCRKIALVGIDGGVSFNIGKVSLSAETERRIDCLLLITRETRLNAG
jgi:hypothetical protein